MSDHMETKLTGLTTLVGLLKYNDYTKKPCQSVLFNNKLAWFTGIFTMFHIFSVSLFQEISIFSDLAIMSDHMETKLTGLTTLVGLLKYNDYTKKPCQSVLFNNKLACFTGIFTVSLFSVSLFQEIFWMTRLLFAHLHSYFHPPSSVQSSPTPSVMLDGTCGLKAWALATLVAKGTVWPSPRSCCNFSNCSAFCFSSCFSLSFISFSYSTTRNIFIWWSDFAAFSWNHTTSVTNLLLT